VTNPAGPDPGIAISPSFRLPQTCSSGDLVAWDTALDPDAFTCIAPGGNGTVTGVGPGTSIAVDNTDPAVPVVSVATPYQLPQAGCGSGEVVTSDGSGGWSCEPAATGTVTGVGQGTGTTVDNTNPAVPVVSVATPYQLPQTGCGSGEVVTSNGSGGWSCEPVTAGTLTGVGPGTGIAVDNTNPTVPVVSVTSPYQLPQTGCGSGEVVTSNGSGGWSCEPAVGGAGTLSKNNIYVNTQGGGAPAVGAFARTASCNDANDIALSGFCRSTGNDVVVLLSQDALNFNTDTLTAQFTCRFRNESNGNGQAGIVCLTVPGP
jgi:hypothetical protein